MPMLSEINRRTFIKDAALSACGVAAGIHVFHSQSDARQLATAGYEGPYRISLNCYSFNAQLTGTNPQMTLADALDFCANNKFDAIDAQGYYFPGYPTVPTDAAIAAFKTKALDLGIAISGTGVNNNFGNADAQGRANDVALVQKWIDVAVKMGAPAIRVFSGNMPAGYETKWDEVAAWIADSIRQCADYGKPLGVKVIVQNHNDMLQTADQIIELCTLVNSDNFGVLLDTGSFTTTNLDADLAKALPYATNFLLKQNVETTLPAVIQLARNSSFQGYLLIEALSGDPLVVVPKYLAEVRSAVSQTTGIAGTGVRANLNNQFVLVRSFAGCAEISYSVSAAATLWFRLLDSRGRYMGRITSVTSPAGRGSVSLDLRHIAPGSYTIGCFVNGIQTAFVPITNFRL
jgi:sugar phosphate isomerase/epimerase